MSDFYVMPAWSPDNCSYCGFPQSQGEHGIIGPSEIEGKVSVKCKVPFDVAPEQVPRLDVLTGVGYVRYGALNERGELTIDQID